MGSELGMGSPRFRGDFTPPCGEVNSPLHDPDPVVPKNGYPSEFPVAARSAAEKGREKTVLNVLRSGNCLVLSENVCKAGFRSAQMSHLCPDILSYFPLFSYIFRLRSSSLTSFFVSCGPRVTFCGFKVWRNRPAGRNLESFTINTGRAFLPRRQLLISLYLQI